MRAKTGRHMPTLAHYLAKLSHLSGYSLAFLICDDDTAAMARYKSKPVDLISSVLPGNTHTVINDVCSEAQFKDLQGANSFVSSIISHDGGRYDATTLLSSSQPIHRYRSKCLQEKAEHQGRLEVSNYYLYTKRSRIKYVYIHVMKCYVSRSH